MLLNSKITHLILLIGSLLSFGFSIQQPLNITNIVKPGEEPNLKETYIDWDKNIKLKQSDFKANSKESAGFAVASTASAFGFSITDNNGEITGNIYVRFYPYKSYWNPEYRNSEVRTDVLEHEQLHFDICELYGRKLYKEIINLRDSGKLDDKHMDILYSRIERQYSKYQDKYDEETNHSINRTEQAKWNKLIKRELNQLSKYSNYNTF